MAWCDQITFVIFTFNEESRVGRAVRNFRSTGKVLVVDNFSSDKTIEVAAAAGAEIFQYKNPGWVEDETTVRAVKNRVETPWIYWAYADEFVDSETLAALIDGVMDPTCRIVNIARKNYYYGRFCRDAYSNRLNRAFEKEAVDFTGNVIHGFGRPTVAPDAIRKLDHRRFFVHHFISNTAKSYLRSIDTYTDVEASQVGAVSVARLGLRVLKTFFVNYVVRQGFRAGRPGLYFGLQMAYYQCLSSMKSFEKEHALTVETIESLNNRVRSELLASVEGKSP